MFLQKNVTRALLVAAVLPIAILKNGVRIVTLSLLARHVDPSFLTGQLHHEGGIVFFLIALLILSPVFVLLQRSERASAGEALSA
jgi:exosortase/archaeosortase family protein